MEMTQREAVLAALEERHFDNLESLASRASEIRRAAHWDFWMRLARQYHLAGKAGQAKYYVECAMRTPPDVSKSIACIVRKEWQRHNGIEHDARVFRNAPAYRHAA